MTAPRDSQPRDNWPEIPPDGTDPLVEVERDRLAGWPDRWPNNQTGADQDND